MRATRTIAGEDREGVRPAVWIVGVIIFVLLWAGVLWAGWLVGNAIA